MAGAKRRMTELKEVYKRVIKVIKYDPEITAGQLKERFGLGSEKFCELRKIALAPEHPDPPEHCKDCGTHTGRRGRCGSCEDLRQRELQNDKGTVRMAAQMFGLVAQMEAVKVRIKAMERRNELHEECYDETHFFSAEQELEHISRKLIQEI